MSNTAGRIRLGEAARRIGVHRRTLLRWCKQGRVRHYVVGPGNYTEFEPADIDALIASMRREPNHP